MGRPEELIDIDGHLERRKMLHQWPQRMPMERYTWRSSEEKIEHLIKFQIFMKNKPSPLPLFIFPVLFNVKKYQYDMNLNEVTKLCKKKLSVRREEQVGVKNRNTTRT